MFEQDVYMMGDKVRFMHEDNGVICECEARIVMNLGDHLNTTRGRVTEDTLIDHMPARMAH